MSRYRLSPLAKADLDDIWFYVAGQARIESADRLIDAITTRFAVVARNPRVGTDRSDLEPGARSIPVRDYLIYFRNEPRGILISRVIHGRRDQKASWRSLG